jgi:DNA excision repair protein ERCC-6-like 2
MVTIRLAIIAPSHFIAPLGGKGDDMGLGKSLQLIALLTALLGKSGTGRDEVVLKKREHELRSVQKDLDSWEESALLGQRGFGAGKCHLADQKKKLQLPDIMPILLIVPVAVIDNWDYEFTIWGHFRVAVYRGGSIRYEALKSIELGSSEVLLCGHSLFSAENDYELIEKIPWKLVVVDEFHMFKVLSLSFSSLCSGA